MSPGDRRLRDRTPDRHCLFAIHALSVEDVRIDTRPKTEEFGSVTITLLESVSQSTDEVESPARHI